jgi:hypothetical protein
MIRVIVPMCAYFIKEKPTGIKFIDSASINVCHNMRIPKYKIFDGIAQQGKGNMG